MSNKYLKAGGKILVCTPCTKLRGITEDQLIEGAQLAGGAALVEFLIIVDIPAKRMKTKCKPSGSRPFSVRRWRLHCKKQLS
jgi:hypothetical protein